MTKEEYEKLLSSDYWKGYSYSLIKERDFTCQDCGRRFFNERNKLQVHHLVYRDVNPWSYKPEEVVVLCRECHEKRHGIISQTPTVQFTQTDTVNQGGHIQRGEDCGYSKSYSSYNKSQVDVDTQSTNNARFDSHDRYYEIDNPHKSFKKYAIWEVIAILLLIAGVNKFSRNHTADSEVLNSLTDSSSIDQKNHESSKRTKSVFCKSNDLKTETEGVTSNAESSSAFVEDDVDDFVEVEEPVEQKHEKSTLELLEEKNHASVVKQAQRAGVSTEGTTIEILERINHASVVKQAKRAGVSTEGTTTEILERINHASVVKQAKRAGVSAEGTTTEILERINHASVVKQAKRAGVSTEGTTTEILERINRKSLESYQ